jgi:hypothetical protein
VGSEGERRKGEGKLGGGEVCSMALGGDRRPWLYVLTIKHVCFVTKRYVSVEVSTARCGGMPSCS